MPTVSVKRDLLFQALGRTYSEWRGRAGGCAGPRLASRRLPGGRLAGAARARGGAGGGRG